MNDRSNEALLARRAKAEAATPGPWIADGYFISLPFVPFGERINGREWAPIAESFGICDSPHIAANSPDVVMEDIDEILRLRGLVDGYKVSMEEAQELINELDQEADWLADQMQKMHAIDGKGKTKCIRGAKEWRELAKAVIAAQPAAESTTSKGSSWSWSK